MNTKNIVLKIYCDFDGTAAKEDVWLNSLGKFINDKKSHSALIKKFEQGEVTTRQCILSELELIENFTFEQFYKYVDEELLDPYFKDFAEFCVNKNYPLTILSEGFDLYIKRILSNHNIDLKFYSNKLAVDDNGKLVCTFPYSDENCENCGVCKRNVLINNTNDLDNEISVFIGDGVSDFCVSKYADIVFAKGKLASYCWKNNITYFEYRNFFDIMKKIEKLETTTKLKHRQEAKNRRRDVLMGG